MTASVPAFCVALESPRGFLQQFRGHAEVHLGGGDADVAQVGGQQRQQALHVRPFAVPGGQPVNGEGVAIIPISE